MNQFFLSLLLGAGGQGGSGNGSPQSAFLSFAPIIAIVAIFYFLIIRPQNKKQKETQRMLSELKKGDKVVSIGGIHGVIQSVREGSIIVKVDENTKLEFTRSAISTVVEAGKAKSDDKKSDIEDKTGNTGE